MNPKEILALAMQAEELRPMVEEVLKALKSYGPELKGLFSDLNDGLTDLKIATIKRYQDAGFTREEAILLTCDQWAQLVKNMNSNKK